MLPAPEHSRHRVEPQASLLLEGPVAGHAPFPQQGFQHCFIIARPQAVEGHKAPNESQQASQNKSKPWGGALKNHVSAM